MLGGVDLVAGGSWLAVNLDDGFVVGVTNARLGAPRGERSRGQLVMELAQQRSAAEAVALLAELDVARYGPFSLLVGSGGAVWTASNTPAPLVRHEDGPVVVLGNDPVASPGPRVALAARQVAEAAELAGTELEQALVRLLSDHEGDDPLCRHGHGYGTVCSSLIVLGPRGVVRYLFAPGPPCITALSVVTGIG